MDLFAFAYPFYERYLTWQITRSSANIPGHVAIILKETDLLDREGLEKFLFTLAIFRKFNVKYVSAYVDIIKDDSQIKAGIVSTLKTSLKEIFSYLPAGLGYTIYGLEGEVIGNLEGKDFFIHISLGFGGRNEITKAVLNILSEVKEGNLEPEQIDEKLLESHLLVKQEPDVMIRSGGRKLSDFLVWQSVYSELFFTDVNWEDIRKIDILRIIRDFQKRQRRYGK